ncbi:MAG: 2-oxoacid ferredoxin oxidoreductase, partial [Archaeoglobaceae archaeon]
YFNTYDLYNERVYEMEEIPPGDQVMDKMMEWDYGGEGKIPIGIFYRESRPTYDESMLKGMVPAKRKKEIDVEDYLKGST